MPRTAIAGEIAASYSVAISILLSHILVINSPAALITGKEED